MPASDSRSIESFKRSGAFAGCRAVAGALILLASLPAAVAAQRPASRFVRLGSEAGLSHNSVYAIAEDREGFLWIGTVDGLNRYDGYEFRAYRNDPGDSTSLSNNLVHALLSDSAGLWVATADGLNRFDPRRDGFRRYRLSDQPAGRTVTALHRDRRAALWVGTESGLFRYEPASDAFARVPVATREGGSNPRVVSIRSDPDGRVWILTGQAGSWELVRADSTGPALALPRPWRDHTFDDFLPGHRGTVWLAAEGPLVPQGGDGALALPTGFAREPSTAWAVLETRRGSLVIGAPDGLHEWDAARQRSTHFLLDRAAAGYPFNWVRALFEDRSGILWVGTHGGLYRRDPNAKPFSHTVPDPSAQGSDAGSGAVSAVFERDSVLWLGTFGNGLNRVDRVTGAVRRFRHRAGDRRSLRDDVVWALHGARDGTIWVGTGGGLCQLNAQTGACAWIDLVRRPGRGEPRVTDIVADASDQLWLATNDGVFRYDPRRDRSSHFALPVRTAAAAPIPESLLAEGDSLVWVGTAPGSLLRLDASSGRFSPATDSSLATEAVWDLHRDPSGTLWLATASGLLRLDPATGRLGRYLHRDGLPGSVVYGIVPDRDGRLWLATNRGLARLDPRTDGPGALQSYAAEDGIGNTEFNRHAVFTNHAGEIFLGGMAGLTSFHPSGVTDNPVPPPVVFTRIESSGREGVQVHNPRGLAQLRLSFRDYSLSFELAALSFTNPAKNRYAHYLEGFDKSWIDAGTRRFVRYTNIPPGTYVLRVRGSNNDGVWNTDGASIILSIAPPFWATWWFQGTLIAAALTAASLAYRARVRRLLALERLRLRIAGDLHDDLSGNLSGIALLSDLILRTDTLGAVERTQLARIGDGARATVEALRDIVWLVDPNRDRLDDLLFRMKDHAAGLLPNVEREFRSSVRHLSSRLSVDIRRQVFLVFKESVHNIARHSRATRVTIDVTEQDGRLQLRISDNGIGFDLAGLNQGSFGVANLRRRATDLGGILEVTSQPGAGTTVHLDVPIT